METVERLTGYSTSGVGYTTASAALELQELRVLIKVAISETVATAIEDKMGAGGVGTVTDGANISKIISDYVRHPEKGDCRFVGSGSQPNKRDPCPEGHQTQRNQQ